MEKSLGEKRVRIDFNPSDKSDVYIIKDETAALINRLETIRQNEIDGIHGHDDERIDRAKEKLRLIELAQIQYELAAMWAVKAVTS